MSRFIVVAILIIVTAIGLWGLTLLGLGDPNQLVLGLRPVGTATEELVWLNIGGGFGVLVVGLAGGGVVCFTLYGAGLLFATGQLTAGLIAFGQLGIGFVLFLGQVGAGIIAGGQGVGGYLSWHQGGGQGQGAHFIRGLNEDFKDLMRFL
jgi:hypothetical protein